MRSRFKDQQTKSRHKRRELQKQWLEEDMAKMTPELKQKKIERKQKKRELQLMKEEEMYRNVLAQSGLEFLAKSQEIQVRKDIRREIKEIIKFERMADRKPGDSTDSQDESSNEENMDRRIEEKVQFGDDSDHDIDEYVLACAWGSGQVNE